MSQFSGIPNEFPVLRKDMWTLSFPPEMNITERFEVTCTRPSWSNSVKEVKYKNGTYKYKGPTKWKDITVEFRDVIGPSVMQKIWAWQREHYDAVNGCGGYPSVYKKNLTLTGEDECGDGVQKWIIYGAFLADVDNDTFDMTSDGEEMKVKLQLAYDEARLEF